MKRNRSFDLIYESAIRRFAEQIYDNFRDFKKLAEFAVYCREKFKDDLVIRLLVEDKRILDEYEKSLERIHKSTSIPILFTLSDLAVPIPAFPHEGEMKYWISLVRDRVKRKRKDVMNGIVYGIVLSEHLSTATRFINALWNISSLKSDLDEYNFILVEGLDGVLTRSSYSLPSEHRRKRKYLWLIKHYVRAVYGVPLREHNFFVEARILTKRYDSLFLLTEDTARTVALKMSLK